MPVLFFQRQTQIKEVTSTLEKMSNKCWKILLLKNLGKISEINVTIYEFEFRLAKIFILRSEEYC